MQQLSDEEIQFFSDARNWGYGPMYEVWMYFSAKTDITVIESIIFEEGNLIPWHGVGPQAVKSILRIDGLPSVGLVHNSLPKRDAVGKNPARSYPCHNVAIYPPQCKRALGAQIKTGLSDLENWDEMDPVRVRIFHTALFQLIRSVSKKVKLISASINTEDRGMQSPYTYDGSVCISPALPPILRVEAKCLPDSYGYFVSVSPNFKCDETS
jgi:hypothetical protein